MPRVISEPDVAADFVVEGLNPTSTTIELIAGEQGPIPSGTALERGDDGKLYIAEGTGAPVVGCNLDDLAAAGGDVSAVVVSRGPAELMLDLVGLPEDLAARWAVLEGLEALGLIVRDRNARPWRNVVPQAVTEAEEVPANALTLGGVPLTFRGQYITLGPG